MSELPTTLEHGTVTGRVSDLLEDVETDAAGYVYFTPLAYFLPMPGETPGRVTSVKPVKADLTDGAFSVELLAMKWEARFYIDGILHRPDPLTVPVYAGEIVDLVDLIPAAGDNVQTEIRTVPAAGVATRSYVDAEVAGLAADTAAALEDKADESAVVAAQAAADAAQADADAANAALPSKANAADVYDKASANARYVPRGFGFGRLITFMGDSIVTYNSANPDAFPFHLCALSGGRLTNYGVYGTGGITLAQVESTYLPQVLALNPKPTFAVIAAITNDIGTGVATATSQATLGRIVDALVSAGIEPVLWKAPPRSDSTSANEATRKWNAWIGFFAVTRGYRVIDGWAPVVDEATGVYLTGYNIDTLHPSVKGHIAIGENAVAAFADITARLPYLTADDHTGGPELVSPSGRMIFTDGYQTGTRPYGWSEYSPYHTGAIVTDATIPGNWFSISRLASEGAGGGGYQFDFASGFSEGDLIYLGLRFDMSCSPLGAGIRPGANFQFRNAGGSTITTHHLLGPGGVYAGFAARVGRVPAGTTTIRIEINISAHVPLVDSACKFAQLTPLNLTALGIA